MKLKNAKKVSELYNELRQWENIDKPAGFELIGVEFEFLDTSVGCTTYKVPIHKWGPGGSKKFIEGMLKSHIEYLKASLEAMEG